MTGRPGLHSARNNLRQLVNSLKRLIIGHDDMINGLLLALVAGENVVIIGPPGIAKTFLVKNLAKRLGANYYMYLLGKFTDFSELFGPIDVLKLAREGKLVRSWSRIVDADIVFLDEIFKANTAILNSLLAFLQERIVYDPLTGEEKQVKLWTLIGASNEVPEDEELKALYDRFPIRIFENYLNNAVLIKRALSSRWSSMNASRDAARASMDDIRRLHDFSNNLLSSGISTLPLPFHRIYSEIVIPAIDYLKEKMEHKDESSEFSISDRTLIEKLPKLYAASLALRGVTPENIAFYSVKDALKYLGDNAEQQKELRFHIDVYMQEERQIIDVVRDSISKLRAGRIEAAAKTLESLKDRCNKDRGRFSVEILCTYVNSMHEHIINLSSDAKRAIIVEEVRKKWMSVVNQQ